MKRNFSIIGCGLIGNLLQKNIQDSMVFDRRSLERFTEIDHDVIVVAAPSSNRLTVNARSSEDLDNCVDIFNRVSKSRYQNLVLIGTVDIYPGHTSCDSTPMCCPAFGYARNRWLFERMIMSLHDSQAIRLPTLCHPTIQKNIIFDLKNQVWLEKINPRTTIQWYPLDRLSQDIEHTLNTGIKFENFVSPPLANHEIITRFMPDLLTKLTHDFKLPQCHYDIKSSQIGYNIDIETIWQSMQEYFTI